MTHDGETKEVRTSVGPCEVFNFMVHFNSEPLIKEAINNDADLWYDLGMRTLALIWMKPYWVL